MPKKQASAYEDAPLPVVGCCFAMCTTRATIRARTPTGWANVCEEHDLELNNREAREWLHARGLERQPGESVREWMCRTLAAVRKRTPPPRPGRHAAEFLAGQIALPPEPGDLPEFAQWTEAPARDTEFEPM